MGFADDLSRFSLLAEDRTKEMVTGIGLEAHRSHVEGSELTGAPGQPVGQYGPGYHPGEVGGALKASWQLWFPDEFTAISATNSEYALPNEDGVTADGRTYSHRSTVGGRHSHKLTMDNMDRIVEKVRRDVVGR